MSYKTIGEHLAKLLEKAQQLRARAQSAGLPKCTECGKPFRKREWRRGIQRCSPLCHEVRMRREREQAEQWLREWLLKHGHADEPSGP